MKLVPFTDTHGDTIYIIPSNIVNIHRIIHVAEKQEDSWDLVELQTVAVGQYGNRIRVKETIEVVVDRINSALQG